MKYRLSDVVEEFVNKDLDGQGNRILVTRAPGDQVRVDFTRDSLVFSPGETFRFTARPHLLPLPEGTKVRLKVQLLSAAGGKEIWSSQHDVQVGHETAIPIELPLPEEEGSYDVLLSVSYNAGWSQAVRRPLTWNKTVAERKVQVLVLDPQPPSGPPPAARGEREFTQLVEIDPANPRWWEIAEAAAIAIAQDVALVERTAGQRQFQALPPQPGQSGAIESQRRFARRELGSLLAADQPAGPAAHSRSRLSQRRAANPGHQHSGTQRRRGAGANRPGFRRRRASGNNRRRRRRRACSGIA